LLGWSQIEELETWNSIYRGKHQGNTRETAANFLDLLQGDSRGEPLGTHLEVETSKELWMFCCRAEPWGTNPSKE